MVFQALQHSVGERSSKHIDTVERYLRGVPGMRFMEGMPRGFVRRLCEAAEIHLLQDGVAAFEAGTPVSSLNVVIAGQGLVTRDPAREETEYVGIGEVADYDDFMRAVASSQHTRSTSVHADGHLLVVSISRAAYDGAMRAQIEDELQARMDAISASGIFKALPQRLRVAVAECLRPGMPLL